MSLSVPVYHDMESAGIATLRRVRALTGIDSIRLVATALLAFLLLDYGRLALAHPVPEQVTPLQVTMDVLAYTAGIIALWRPRIGLGVAAIPLTAGLVWTSTSLDAFLLAVVTGLALSQLSRRSGGIASVALVAYVGVRAVLYTGDQRIAMVAMLATSLAIGLLFGWVGLLLRERSERAALSEARLSGENLRIRADERRTLSRELHDVVAHHLSTASLQIMGSRGTQNPDELSRVLDTVDEAAGEALTELRLLVQVLRDDPATAASGTELRELAEMLPPTEAAAEAERALLDAGFETRMELPAAIDGLSLTVQRTLTRTIRQATDNVIRHAPPKCRVEVQGRVRDHEVILTITNPVPPGTRPPCLGWGLRGLRERASLTGGSLSAGIQSDNWVVSLALPTT